MAMLSGCNYLDDYSQDLVVVRSVADLDEVLLGSVYMPSKEEVEELAWGDVGWWRHILDDDVNTVVAPQIGGTSKMFALMTDSYFGYFAWQMEVGRNYRRDNVSDDNALWDDFYGRINVANIILDEMDKLDLSDPDELRNSLRVRGETHFLRAWFYFLLANFYADAYEPDKAAGTPGVPLKLTSWVEHDKDKETQFDRASLAGVYAQIVKDLKEAVTCFDESPQTHAFYRASGKAARLLLSRVYLYMQDWKNARILAEELLAENMALRDYAAVAGEEEVVISRTNPEILFSQGSLNVQNEFTGEGGNFCISSDLYSLYSDDDYRKKLFFEKSVSSDSIGLGRKYRRGLHQSYVSDLYMLRASEAWLNAAEACAMLGDAVSASGYLNHFRKNRIAGWQDVTYDEAQAIGEVRLERRKEFCLEGHRWLDLRRYAVCRKAPWKKPVTHFFALYTDKNKIWRGEMYRLEPDDGAYTFAIPRKVLEFDKGMPDNIRPERKAEAVYMYN